MVMPHPWLFPLLTENCQIFSHNLHVRQDQPAGEDTSSMPTTTATKKQDNEKLTTAKISKTV
jgi:hypothetical protein